jgi:hypothetical protein
LSAGFDKTSLLHHHQSTKQVCCTTTNQQNKFALEINACWQNFFYDMCVTPANIVEEHLHHRHLVGCIEPLMPKANHSVRKYNFVFGTKISGGDH